MRFEMIGELMEIEPVADAAAAGSHLAGESADGYLYPAPYFIPVEVPLEAECALGSRSR